MQRRDFLNTAAIFASLAGLSNLPNLTAGNPMVSNRIEPFLLPPLPPLDHKGVMDIRVWVRNNMTNGVFSCVECAVAPKVMGPPPHFHLELDELMYVLDGTANIYLDGQYLEVPTGAWHFRPRGLTHTFFNASDKPLRFIDMYFNQPFEDFLEKVFFQYTPEKGYPFGSKERDAVMGQLNEQFGLVYAPNSGAERQIIADKFGLK